MKAIAMFDGFKYIEHDYSKVFCLSPSENV